MILYHFTAISLLDPILRDGLTRGDVPLSPEGGMNAVWFTTDPSPSGHGLSDGSKLSPEMLAEVERRTGKKFPEGIGTPDKRRVRITVVIPSRNPLLKSWLPYARRRLERSWLETLTETGGGKSKAQTWFIYLGSVAATSFKAVEIRREDGAYTPMTEADRIEAAQHSDAAPASKW